MSEFCNPGEMITVLVADSENIRRQLLTRELQRQSLLRIQSCGADPGECKHVLSGFPADILVWAANSHRGSHHVFSGMEEVLSSHPSMRGVALFPSWDNESVLSAFRAGVYGLFSERGSVDELRKCIACVHQGEVWASNAQMRLLVDSFRRSPVVRVANVKGKNLLTPRQQQLVELVSEGMGNREIARRLKITENTVKKSLLRIFDRVGVSNRVELALSALSFRNMELENVSRKQPCSASIADDFVEKDNPECHSRSVLSVPHQN
jgi:DNA-binding NarL/FixJ family response regulator